MRSLSIAVAILCLTACAGKVTYQDPLNRGKNQYFVIIDKARDTVWNSSIPELGKKIFVINTIDKSSGLINLSYSGNPEDFIDCGRIISEVSNLAGDRTYSFAASNAYQNYEVMQPSGLYFVQRKIALEGRVNLVYEEQGPAKTKVTANTRYVVKRNIQIQKAGANTFPQTIDDSISFNTGGGASFPADRSGRFSSCVPTGSLETEILSMIK